MKLKDLVTHQEMIEVSTDYEYMIETLCPSDVADRLIKYQFSIVKCDPEVNCIECWNQEIEEE